MHRVLRYVRDFRNNIKKVSNSDYKTLFMYIGTYLLETPGSDLEVDVLKEVESMLLRVGSFSLSHQIDSATIDELYNEVSVVTMLLKNGILIIYL